MGNPWPGARIAEVLGADWLVDDDPGRALHRSRRCEVYLRVDGVFVARVTDPPGTHRNGESNSGADPGSAVSALVTSLRTQAQCFRIVAAQHDLVADRLTGARILPAEVVDG